LHSTNANFDQLCHITSHFNYLNLSTSHTLGGNTARMKYSMFVHEWENVRGM